VEWSDWLASGDAFAQRHRLEPKCREQVSPPAAASEPFPSGEIVADVEAYPRAALRKDEVMDVAFRPCLVGILWPLRHTVYQHSADQIMWLILAYGEAELALDDGIPSVGPARQSTDRCART
jgi:hypothetical protein